MPVHLGRDKQGDYYQWGETGKKYYIKEYGKEGALKKAREQEKAIRASGWKGDSKMRLICVRCDDSGVANQKGEYRKFTGEIDWKGTKGQVSSATFELTPNGVVWKDGTWNDGTWNDGKWEYGVWKKGVWKRGTWESGAWKGGTWQDGTWQGGLWEGGTWEKGTWEGGNWYNGTWKNGEWRGGTWKKGAGKPENA